MPYDCLEYDSMFIRNCSPKGEGGTLENLETDLPLCMGPFLLQKIHNPRPPICTSIYSTDPVEEFSYCGISYITLY